MVAGDPFCSDEIYKQVFLETKRFIAVYNIAPVLPGHTLIIPKRHITYITELTSAELSELSSTLRKMLPVFLKAYGANSYNLSVNAGRDAGMTIEHLHFHLVPRKPGDAFHGKISMFYKMLASERPTTLKNGPAELARLRKAFKYKKGQKAV